MAYSRSSFSVVINKKRAIQNYVLKKAFKPPSQKYMAQVAQYEKAMLRELDANTYKRNYRGLTERALLIELQMHLDKLRLAVDYQHHDKSSGLDQYEKARILEFSADLGNLAFMLADVCHALDEEIVEKRRKERDYVAFDLGA